MKTEPAGYNVDYTDGRKLNLTSGNQKRFEKALERGKKLGVVKDWKRSEGESSKVDAPKQSANVSVIEAEGLGKCALGKDYEKYSQLVPQKTGRYEGKIVAENQAFVVQQLTPLHTVRHDKQALSQVPRVGQRVRIGYSAGLGNVCEAPKIERSRSRSL